MQGPQNELFGVDAARLFIGGMPFLLPNQQHQSTEQVVSK